LQCRNKILNNLEDDMESNIIKIKTLKPRNALVELAHNRKAGFHLQTEKAKRTQIKASLKKDWLNQVDHT